MLEKLDPALLGLPHRIEEAKRASTIDGGLAPAVGILLAFCGATLLGQAILPNQLVLVLLLRDELLDMQLGEA
ncbi:MAG: hypothetical protein ACLFNA_10435 [Halochromatium sp.]